MADVQKDSELRWDDIQKKARKNHDLVYAFDQERPKVTNGLPVPDNGYCVGITLRWIALRYSGEDYDYDAEEKLGLKIDFQALTAQYRSRSTPGGPFLRAQAVLRDFHVSTNPGRNKQIAQPASADMLINATAQDGLYYIEMRGKDPDGTEHAHALAIQREKHGAIYRFFDSNEGHFLLKGTARFKAFLTGFLNATPYKKEYLVGTWIVGVDPPAK